MYNLCLARVLYRLISAPAGALTDLFVSFRGALCSSSLSLDPDEHLNAVSGVWLVGPPTVLCVSPWPCHVELAETTDIVSTLDTDCTYMVRRDRLSFTTNI